MHRKRLTIEWAAFPEVPCEAEATYYTALRFFCKPTGRCDWGKMTASILVFEPLPTQPYEVSVTFPTPVPWGFDGDEFCAWKERTEATIDYGVDSHESFAAFLAVLSGKRVDIGPSYRVRETLEKFPREEPQVPGTAFSGSFDLGQIPDALNRLVKLPPVDQKAISIASKLYRLALRNRAVDVEVSYVQLVSCVEAMTHAGISGERKHRPTARFTKLVTRGLNPEQIQGRHADHLPDNADVKAAADLAYEYRSCYLHDAVPFSNQIDGVFQKAGFTLGKSPMINRMRPPGSAPVDPQSALEVIMPGPQRTSPSFTWHGMERIARFTILKGWGIPEMF